MTRLNKLIKQTNNIEEFVQTVLHFLKWYSIPVTWTKADLKSYYFNHGGK